MLLIIICKLEMTLYIASPIIYEGYLTEICKEN